jgi:UDP-2,3-diacylglucosamine pyrophosphatase LpxH
MKTLYRAVFLSDLHLGFRGARADVLFAFLKTIECEYLYLVGDIFDLWAVKARFHWNHDCTAVICHILKLAKHGTKVIYVPGNHDDALRHFIPITFGPEITIQDHIVHTTFTGKDYLVIHGDQFDFVARWLSVFGTRVYDLLIHFNNLFQSVRTTLGFRRYWSLAGYLKHKTKTALNAIQNFELAVINFAKKLNCNGVICGHIHTAKLYTTGEGMEYMNCGDWIESFTAIIETIEGEVRLLHLNNADSE